MNYLYSANANAFFPFSLKENYEAVGKWPEDGREVTEDIFNQFATTPPDGKMLGPDKDGLPSWADVPPPSKEELINTATSKQTGLIQEANAFINNRQWPGKAALGRLKGDDLAAYNKWLDYLDALYAVDTSKAPNITWPQKPE